MYNQSNSNLQSLRYCNLYLVFVNLPINTSKFQLQFPDKCFCTESSAVHCIF